MTHRAAPLLTVIIPTWNYGRFIGTAIESVLDQAGDHHPAVIVVDDGSTDDTPAAVSGFKDRIRYLRQANQGVSAARNHGLHEARTEWIVFLDADDRLVPDALNRFQESIERHPAARLHCGHYISVRPDGARRESARQPILGSPAENFRRFIQRDFTISIGTACYHRDAFQRIRYPVGMTHGEHIVVDGQILANFPAVSIPHPLAEILEHSGRARDQTDQMQRCGTSTVEVLFNPDILPAAAMACRPLFLARWNLSLARACYRAGRFHDARRHYEQAAASRWTSLLDVKHGLRYLNSIWRAA